MFFFFKIRLQLFVVSSCVLFNFSFFLVGVPPHFKQEQVLLLLLLLLLLTLSIYYNSTFSSSLEYKQEKIFLGDISCVRVCVFLFEPISIILIERFSFSLSFIITDVMNFCALSCLYFISASRFVKTQNYLDFVDTYIHQVFCWCRLIVLTRPFSPIVPSV